MSSIELGQLFAAAPGIAIAGALVYVFQLFVSSQKEWRESLVALVDRYHASANDTNSALKDVAEVLEKRNDA